MLATVVAEVLGLEPSDIAMVTADTDLTPVDLGSYSSRVTFMGGNAALEAGTAVKDRVFAAVADKLGAPIESLVAQNGRIEDAEEPDTGVSWAEAVALAIASGGPLIESGGYRAPSLRDLQGCRSRDLTCLQLFGSSRRGRL